MKKELTINIENVLDIFDTDKLIDLSMEQLAKIPFDKFDYIYDKFTESIKNDYFDNSLELFRLWSSYLNETHVINYNTLLDNKKYDIVEERLRSENIHMTLLDFMESLSKQEVIYYVSLYYIFLGGINSRKVNEKLNEFVESGLTIQHKFKHNNQILYFLI